MKPRDNSIYYKVTPRIVRANTTATITISPKYNMAYFDSEYTVVIWPLHNFDAKNQYHEATYTLKSKEELVFSYDFGVEQEYLIQLFLNIKSKDTKMLIAQKSIYALEDDLYQRKPYKGDLHMHTVYSDGWESPERMMAACREYGLDFMAITDHYQYFDKATAKALMERFYNNMIVFSGEETSAQDCTMHILSLDADKIVTPEVYIGCNNVVQKLEKFRIRFGNFGNIHKWLGADEDASDDQLIEIMRQKATARAERIEEIKQRCKTEAQDLQNKDAYFAAVDAFEQIRAAGGFSVMAHTLRPGIKTEEKRRNCVPLDVTDALLKNNRCDAFEICSGGVHKYPPLNSAQEKLVMSHYPDCKGMPVIGVTDSHKSIRNLCMIGQLYTVAFAKEFSAKGIRQAILDGYSLAVEKYDPKGHRCRGNLRLSFYTDFLVKEYFPEQDKISCAQGELMRQILCGQENADKALQILCDCGGHVHSSEWWGHCE